jgi:hypothetical protein
MAPTSPCLKPKPPKTKRSQEQFFKELELWVGGAKKKGKGSKIHKK